MIITSEELLCCSVKLVDRMDNALSASPDDDGLFTSFTVHFDTHAHQSSLRNVHFSTFKLGQVQ